MEQYSYSDASLRLYTDFFPVFSPPLLAHYTYQLGHPTPKIPESCIFPAVTVRSQSMYGLPLSQTDSPTICKF